MRLVVCCNNYVYACNMTQTKQIDNRMKIPGLHYLIKELTKI